MKKIGILLLILASFTLSCVTMGGALDRSVTDSGLRASIISEPFYYSGQPVMVTFRLENVSEEDIILQSWESPDKQRRWNLMRDGYQDFEIGLPLLTDDKGGLVPCRDNYGDYLTPKPVWLVIKAGEDREIAIDLSETYDLTVPGEYTLASLYASFRNEDELTEEDWPSNLPFSWDAWQQHPMPPRVWEGVLFPNSVTFAIGRNYTELVSEEEERVLGYHEVNHGDTPVLLPNVMRPLLAVHADEPAQYTYNNRFSHDEAILDMEQINDALEGFRILTDDANKAGIITRESPYFPMTGWEAQNLGFPNWTGTVDGTLRKQRMEMAQLRCELAAIKLQRGEIDRDAVAAAEEEYRIATQEFIAFWDSFGIAD